MEITYLGHSSFRIRGKNATLVTDPFDPAMVGLKFSKLSADIVTISHDHQDHNKVDLVTDSKKVIDGPGEYEINGVSIIGIQTYHDEDSGSKRGKNTLYVYEIDGLRLAHLGDLGHKLSDEVLEEIGTLDILMVPVGGVFTVGPEEAAAIVRDIEPAIVLPMHFRVAGLNPENFSELSDVAHFVQDAALPSVEMDKLVIKKEDIPEGEKKIVLLKVK
jgi:L-ascorbate metabolism protein UlaG (beta-lactamase superfamily)